MNFSVMPVLDTKRDKDGNCKIYLRVIANRKKIDIPSGLKVLPQEWDAQNRQVVKRLRCKEINRRLIEKKQDFENKVMSLPDTNLSIEQLKAILTRDEKEEALTKKILVTDFIYDMTDKHVGGKWSPGFVKHYKVLAGKIKVHSKALTFDDVSVNWLTEFEKYLRETGLSENTVHAQMKKTKGIMSMAEEQGYIEGKQYRRYKLPRYTNPMPSYLTAQEVEYFEKAVDATRNRMQKMAGAYFLFSCATGLRISDMKKFSVQTHIVDDMFVLRATKNKKIISLPLYEQLRKALERIKDMPFDMAEQTGNNRLKELAIVAGLEKEKMSWHVGRHTFAMNMIRKGFNIDEVATLLGDSVDVARIYASISNDQIHERFIQIFGSSD